MTEPGGPGRWQAAMARVDTDLLDCLAVNVAVLLADQGATDVRTPFAARWRFDPAPGGTDPLRHPAAERHLEAGLRDLGGQRLTWHQVQDLGSQRQAWTHTCAGGQGVLVAADAFDMPWLPYAGHQHMEHSFIVTAAGHDELVIADGYTNATEWGRAEPLTATIATPEIAALLAGGGRWAVLAPAAPPPVPGLAEVVRRNAGEIAAAHDAGRYDAFLRDAAAQIAAGNLAPLSVHTWLLARNRKLHARWLDDQGSACLPEAARKDFAGSVAAAWARAAELAYIGLRRARAGRAVPPSVTEAVQQACSAEVSLARTLYAADGEGS
jgi:hypothetical protein